MKVIIFTAKTVDYLGMGGEAEEQHWRNSGDE